MYSQYNNPYHDDSLNVVMQEQPLLQGFPGEDHHYYRPSPKMHFPFSPKKKAQVPLAPTPRYIFQQDLNVYPQPFESPYVSQPYYVQPTKKKKRPRSPVLPSSPPAIPIPESRRWMVDYYYQSNSSYSPPYPVHPQPVAEAPQVGPPLHQLVNQPAAAVPLGFSPVMPIQGLDFWQMRAAAAQNAQTAGQSAHGMILGVTPTQGLSYMPALGQVQAFPVLPVTYASPVVVPLPLQDTPPQAPLQPAAITYHVETPNPPPLVPPAFAQAPALTPTTPPTRPHRMLQLGHVRIDMSKPSLSEALPSCLFEFLNSPASEVNLSTIKLNCDAFTEPLTVSGHGRVTIGQILEAVHRRVHSPVDEDNSPAAQAEMTVTHSGRRSFFDRVRVLDLLHGQHHFIGLRDAEGANWNIVFD